MRYYELMFISDPANEEGSDVIKEKIEGIIGENEGSINSYDKMGKKRLAYPITKRLYGIYNLVNFQGNASVVAPLENFLRLNSQIFRHIILVFSEKTLKLRTETQRIQVEEDERMRRGGRPTHELSDLEKKKISSQTISGHAAIEPAESLVSLESNDLAGEMISAEPVSSFSLESNPVDTNVPEENITEPDQKSLEKDEDDISKETAE